MVERDGGCVARRAAGADACGHDGPAAARWSRSTAGATRLLTVGECLADDLLALCVQLSMVHPVTVGAGADRGPGDFPMRPAFTEVITDLSSVGATAVTSA